MVYWKPVTAVGGLLGLFSSAFASPTNTTSSQTTSTWSQTTSTSLETVSTVSSSTAPSLTATPIPSALTLKVNTKSGVRNKTAPLLHGIFFEELNNSGEGGLYAELIRNRAFLGSDLSDGVAPGATPWAPTLVGWKSIGGAVLSLDLLNPLSDALRTVLKVDIPATATGEVGFLNEGWWGMNVQPQDYDASFYIKPNGALYKKNVTGVNLSLRSAATNDIWATTRVEISQNISTTKYTKLEAVLTPPAAAPNKNNTFAITFDAAEAKGQTFYFDLISLFPPTFKGRKNGLRKDLAEHLYNLKPRFMRFPGGYDVTGNSIETRWNWKKNIGPLTERPGRAGNWGYWENEGIGYLEYLQWCEDFEMEPLVTIYAGYSGDLAGVWPAHTVEPDDLDFYINEAIEQLEYAMGGVDTKWGALRAEHGHPEPFSIKFVEIGNEDWFSDSYYWRYPRFRDGLAAVYPNVTYIASQATEDSPANHNVTIPPGGMWDLHHFETPQYFKDNFNFFDNWQEIAGYPDVKIFIGEHSVLGRDRVGGIDWVNGEGRFKFPAMVSAIGEAIYAISMERNPNIVTHCSYAVLFQNLGRPAQWTPNFISFTADPSETVLSASYYKTWMFSHHHGTETLPVENTEGDFNPVWWHASIEAGSATGTVDTVSNSTQYAQGNIYVKLVNAAKQPAPVTLKFDTAIAKGNGTILHHDDEFGFNYLGNQTAISPQPFDLEQSAISNDCMTVTYAIPGLSVVVLELEQR
ncbi:glycoside hydrolase family 51 protein [Serendipita vermifera MAFF 305830]|uniref:non-reducing end alpha-L-arabinofuranosidase n=1 Tax=Serendipita vermifera MAFF 305830 TaxID=933852 RepID=A0A0C3A6W5_SERVB|nr:glycoside hydrolase family 51 protein [Serendipita vermifera MAFF 305830]